MSTRNGAPLDAAGRKLAEDLINACGSGNTKDVRACLAHGANPEGSGAISGNDPLDCALSHNHIEAAHILVAAGATVTRDVALSVLLGEHPEAVAFCLAHGIDANAVLCDDTVAYHAVRSGNTDITRVVYENGGRFDGTGKDGRPVSHALTWIRDWHCDGAEGKLETRFERALQMAAWLSAHDGDLRAADNLGRTALSEAMRFWQLPAVLALLRYGGVGAPQDAFSIVANILAKVGPESPRLEPFVQHLVSDPVLAPVLRCRDYKGRSLLHWAAKRSTPKTLARLVEAGLSASEKDTGGKRPAAYARTNSEDAKAILLAAEAKERLTNPGRAGSAPSP